MVKESDEAETFWKAISGSALWDDLERRPLREDCIHFLQSIVPLFVIQRCPWPPPGWRIGDEVRYGPLSVKIHVLCIGRSGQQYLGCMTRVGVPLIIPLAPQSREMAHRITGWDDVLSPDGRSVKGIFLKPRKLILMIASAAATALYVSRYVY